MTANDLYSKYGGNPIKWMKENNCITTKQITIKLMQDFAKYHVELALKAASEDVELETYGSFGNSVNKDSILNAYSIDLIK